MIRNKTARGNHLPAAVNEIAEERRVERSGDRELMIQHKTAKKAAKEDTPLQESQQENGIDFLARKPQRYR